MDGPELAAHGAPAADAAPEIRPYPGLRPFREDESHLFFGRESHRRELLRRLVASRFVAVVGTSGSGKSSLIRAGLFPDLYSGYLPRAGSDWVVVETSPGNDPIGRLAARFTAAGWPVTADDLRTNSMQVLESAAERLEPGQHLLLLIDQFEELFRLAARSEPVADHDEKASFVRLLLQAGGQAGAGEGNACVHVVIAMRSEFLGRASTFRGLPEAIDQGQYLIPRLSREELRKAIVSPAHVASGDVEEALVQRLLSELGDGDDQLPVLQHALMRSWDIGLEAGKAALDHTSYEDSGGLEQALSNDASEVLGEAKKTAGPDAERVVKRVFQSLRATDVNGGQTRRPTTVKELCEIAACDRGALERAIDPFRARSFLVPTPGVELRDDTLIDVSHEALLRRWTTLLKWIEEDELHRRLYLRIASRAADEEGSVSHDYFAMPLLGLLEKFWNDRQPPRAWAVRHHPGYEAARTFLDASIKHQRGEDAKANRRVRLRLAVAVLAVILIVAGGLLWRLYRSYEDLDVQSRVLEAEVIASRAATTLGLDVEARTQLAAEALRRRSTPEAQWLLLQSLGALAKPLRDAEWAASGKSSAVTASVPALSRDGEILFVADAANLRAITLATGEGVFTVPRPGQEGLTLMRAGDTRLLALSNDAVYVVDTGDGRQTSTMGIRGLVAGAVSADGTTAAFVSGDRAFHLCRLANECRDLRPLGKVMFDAVDVALSGDGKRAIVVGADTGDIARSFALYHTAPFRRVVERALEVQGEPLALALDNELVRLCSTTQLASYDVYDDSLDPAESTSFPADVGQCFLSPDQAAALHDDGSLRVWDRGGNQITMVSVGSDTGIRIAYGGSRLVAVGERLRAWDLAPYGWVRDVPTGARMRADGKHLLVDASLIAVDTGAVTSFRESIPAVAGGPATIAVIGSSTNSMLLTRRTGPASGAVIFADWREGSGALRERWRVPFEDVARGGYRLPIVGLSDDGRYVSVVMSGGRTTTILDAATGEAIRRIEGMAPSFVPGQPSVLVRVFAASGDASFQVFPLPDGEPRDVALDRLFAPNQIGAAAFSADGKLLAVAEMSDAVPNVESGQRRRTVLVVDWPALTPRATLLHTAPVTDLMFRGDSTALLTSTPSESSIHAWDLTTATEFARVPVARRGATPSMAFTPSGQIAFTDGAGLTVLPLEPDEWVKEACARLARNLSKDEWSLVVGENVQYTRTCPSLP